jgi:hypothetical protein
MPTTMSLTFDDQEIIREKCTKMIRIYKLAANFSILAIFSMYVYLIYIGLIPQIGVLETAILVFIPILALILQNWFLRVKLMVPFHQMLQAQEKEIIEGKIVSDIIHKSRPLLIEVGEEQALHINKSLWVKSLHDIQKGDLVRVHRVLGIETKIFSPGVNVFRVERI